MKQIINLPDSSKLNRQQRDRLYDVYIFNSDEIIEVAYYYRGQLYIYYADRDAKITLYKPELNLSNNEDKEKIEYILNGDKEEEANA